MAETVELKAGQFWRDKVNKDVLRILSFSFEVTSSGSQQLTGEIRESTLPGNEYARCDCFVHGTWFGIQEMKSSHFSTDRFEPLSKLAAYWILGKARLRALWRR